MHVCLVAWASLVVLVIKNLPADAGDAGDKVQSLGWEDYLEEGMTIHSSILSWRNSIDKRSLAGCNPWGLKEMNMDEWLSMHSMDMLLCPWDLSWQEYWSGLPSLPSEYPGIEPASPVSPVLDVDSLSTEPSGKSFLRFKPD